MEEIKNRIYEKSFELIKEKYEGDAEDEKVELEESHFHIVSDKIYKGLFLYLKSKRSKKKDVSINLFNLLTLGLNYEEAEEGEKQGNYVPYIEMGSRMAELLNVTEDIREGKIKEKEIQKAIKFVLEATGMSNRINGDRRSDIETLSITLENRILGIIEVIKEELKEAESVTVSDMDYFSIKIDKEEDEVKYLIIVGPESKLIVKDDEDTEDEDE